MTADEHSDPAVEEAAGRVAASLAELQDLLLRWAEGDPAVWAPREGEPSAVERINNAIYDAKQAAWDYGNERRVREQITWPVMPSDETASWADVLRDRVRTLRNLADWTQAQLAEAMIVLGFDWKRSTVAEIETGKRRVSLEEAIGLAVLFGVPVYRLMTPRGSARLEVTPRLAIDRQLLEELFFGHIGLVERVSFTGAHWPAARQASELAGAGDDYWRPAWDMWRNRLDVHNEFQVEFSLDEMDLHDVHDRVNWDRYVWSKAQFAPEPLREDATPAEERAYSLVMQRMAKREQQRQEVIKDPDFLAWVERENARRDPEYQAKWKQLRDLENELYNWRPRSGDEAEG